MLIALAVFNETGGPKRENDTVKRGSNWLSEIRQYKECWVGYKSQLQNLIMLGTLQ